MNSRRPRNFRNNFDRIILDKQVDKIFETGRQFVDGVSGSRPCLLYTSPSPRDRYISRMPSSA